MGLLGEHLRARAIERPSVWVLGRMIGAAREAAHGEIVRRLADQLPAERRGELDRLVEVDPERKVSELVWLRAPAGRVGVKGALAQVASTSGSSSYAPAMSTCRRYRQVAGSSSPPRRGALTPKGFSGATPD